jgi:hypothetical protein
MAEESLQEQGPERTGPVVVVTIEEDGTVDTRSNMGAYVFVVDRRLRSRDQAIQVGGLAASLRTLLEGLSGKDEVFVKQVASDLVRAVKSLKLDVDEYGPSSKERAQVNNLKKSLERRLEEALLFGK